MRVEELRIGNYLGHYVYENGIIISSNGKQISENINDKGYPQVSLFYNGKNYSRRVHRILAELFIPNPENKPQVNHKDRNRANYDLENLEWSTAKENVIHSVINGGRLNWFRDNKMSKNPKSKLCENDVVNIRSYYNNKIFTQVQLSKKYQLGVPTINKIIKNKLWNFALTNQELNIEL